MVGSVGSVVAQPGVDMCPVERWGNVPHSPYKKKSFVKERNVKQLIQKSNKEKDSGKEM